MLFRGCLIVDIAGRIVVRPRRAIPKMIGAAVTDGDEVRVVLGLEGPARCSIVEAAVAAVVAAHILRGRPVVRLQRDRICSMQLDPVNLKGRRDVRRQLRSTSQKESNKSIAFALRSR
jgi:hypothetical protein